MQRMVRAAALCGALVSAAVAASAEGVFEGIEGSGRVRTETRDVRRFTAIQVDGSGEVELRQGDRQSVVVEADDNVLDVVATEVRGSVLHLGFKPGTRLWHVTRLRFTVTAPSIEGIRITGSGDVRCADRLRADSLSLSISGSGSIDADVDTEALSLDIQGSGAIAVRGRTGDQSISLGGSGNVSSRDLVSADARVHVSGSGNVSVTASRTLDIDMSGSGHVQYGGGAAPTIRSSGSGSVRTY